MAASCGDHLRSYAEETHIFDAVGSLYAETIFSQHSETARLQGGYSVCCVQFPLYIFMLYTFEC